MTEAPLSGLLVVDLSRHLPGPLAARLLADLGARVIKVEEPGGGDPVRRAPPFFRGQGALATVLLSGVQSIALDLKRPGARGVLGGLLQKADVLLESFRPGTLTRLGFDPSQLRRRFPRLLICSLSGFGQQGPHAARSGHDLTYQALAGALASTAAMPGLPVADVAGAWSAVASILAVLWERERTGRGRWIDACLLDSAVHANVTGWAAEAEGEKGVGEPLALTGALPCYNLYRTSDGRCLALAALEARFWRRFCQAAGRRDLVRLQYRREPEARQRVGELIASRPLAEWLRLAETENLPLEPVLVPSEVREHPQVRARPMVRQGQDGLLRLAYPGLLDGERPAASWHFPALGQDTREILAELGVAEAAYSPRRLRAAGIGPRFSLRRTLFRLLTRR